MLVIQSAILLYTLSRKYKSGNKESLPVILLWAWAAASAAAGGRPGAKLAPGLHPQAAPSSITSLSLLLLMNEFFVGYLQVTAVTKSLPAVGLTATRHTVLRPVPITLAIDKRNPTIISQTGPKHNCLLHLSLVATITGTSEIEC